MSLKQQ
jgi:hypothetical protein